MRAIMARIWPRLARNIIFLLPLMVLLLTVKYRFFATPATSFYTCNQDLLLMDIHLSQGTYNLACTPLPKICLTIKNLLHFNVNVAKKFCIVIFLCSINLTYNIYWHMLNSLHARSMSSMQSEKNTCKVKLSIKKQIFTLKICIRKCI